MSEDTTTPETDPDVLAAYAAGDKIVQRMKTAEAQNEELKAQIVELEKRLDQAEADKQAAVAKALNDYKASLGAVPFPP